MSNLNKVFLMGRLTRDPEIRYTPQGTPVAEIGLAVNREYTVGTERRKETTFVDVTLWKRQAEVVCQYLKRGSPLFVEGRLSLDSWETPDGQKRSKMRVVAENFQFVGGRSEGEGGGGRGGYGAGAASADDSYGDRTQDPDDASLPRGSGARPGGGGSAGGWRASGAPPGARGDARVPAGREAPDPGSLEGGEDDPNLGLEDSEIPF